MDKNYILQKLSQEKEYIQSKYEVDKIGLFGSYAKETQTEDSDIDIYKERNQIGKHKRMKRSYDKLDSSFINDLELFMKFDDMAKKSF